MRFTINDIWQLIFNTAAKALKIIELGITFPHRADAINTVPVIVDVSAVSAVGDLKTNTNYRMIANVDVWFELAESGSPTAVADVDIYVPAKNELRFNSGSYEKIAVVASGAGKLQYAEIS